MIAWLVSSWLPAVAAGGSAPTLAVADLQNFTGDERYDPAGAGAATLLTDRFTGLSSVRVVERAELEAGLDELSLDPSDLVERTVAVRAGRQVGADYLVFGSLVGVRDGALAVDLRVVDTDSARIVLAEHLVSPLGEAGAPDLVGALADRLVAGLDLAVSADELRQVRAARDGEVDSGLSDGGADDASPLDANGLVDWLAQPSADPRSCDPASTVSPRLARPDPGAAVAVVDAHRAGRLAGRRVVACLGHLDARLSDDAAQAAWSSFLETARRRLKEGDAAARTGALEALAGRPAGVSFDPRVRTRFERTLARLPDDSLVREVIATFELEGGEWLGAPVTVSRLQGFDDATIAMMERLHPDAGLREAARTVRTRRELERSPLAVVRERDAEVLASVLERGFWPVPADWRVTSVAWDPALAVRRLHIVAAPAQRGGRLVVEHPDGGWRGSAFDLDGLRVTFEGFEEPVGICPPEGTRPPIVACVDPEQITLLHPRASTVGRALVIRPWLTIDEIVAFARSGLRMTLPLRVHGQRVPLDLEVGLVPVAPLAFAATSGAGPDLVADVFALIGGRQLVEVQPAAGGRRHAAVVEAGDDAFRVISQGAPGRSGAEGGCGADGEPGAPGGTVTVRLHCDDGCRAMERWARKRFVSRGGPGGRGGDCPDGATRPGTRGRDGRDGPAGEPGALEIRVVD